VIEVILHLPELNYIQLIEIIQNLLKLFLSLPVVRYPNVSLSPTLSRNEKVEQHIRKKIHKPNVLRFWVEGGVISLYGFDSVLILVRSSGVYPLELPKKWYQSRRFVAVTDSYECSLIPIVSGKREVCPV